MSCQEKKTIEEIVNRNEKTLLIFYKTHHTSVFNFIYRKIGKKGTSEELTQDVFMDFIENLRDFRGESSLKTYLFTIARYKVIDYMKKKKIKKILFSAIPRYVVENLKSIFIDDELQRKELAEKIEKTLSALPNDYEVVLRLKYVDDRKVQDIAKKLTLSFKATESLLYRARIAFKKTFQIVV